MFPDKQIREQILSKVFYPTVGQVDLINRLHSFYVKAGKPKVDAVSSIFVKNRPHYNPLDNTIHLGKNPALSSYISELSHAVQYAQPGKMGETVKDVITHPLEYLKNMGKNGDRAVYKRKGSIEYEAHSVIEPQIKQTVFNK